MLRYIKDKVQHYLLRRAQEKYEAEKLRQQEPYLQWILEHEDIFCDGKTIPMQELQRAREISVIRYQQCTKHFTWKTYDNEILIFASGTGTLSPKAVEQIADVFENSQEVLLLYGDEDYLEEDGKRVKPWFKPEWSPDTLLSFFYFGSIFAVRKSVLPGIEGFGQDSYLANLYDFVLKITETIAEKSIFHMEEVLFHNRGTSFFGASEEYNSLKTEAAARRGWQVRMAADREQFYALIYEAQERPLVSIIIPSKDNPEVLRRCLDSIRHHNQYQNYEVIVVDNGSSEEHKKELEQLCEEDFVTYLYRSMPFNFSKMCNIGVREAKGDYILLLNDDCEVTQPDWLERLLGQASLEHVGAVGAKLLYPQNRLIQHVGITNLEIGPAHKLVKMSDEPIYYHGQNWLVYDMIGVTAACLMIAKRKYEAVQGFCEELAVSYNDVDFCFALLEKGYYNVQRNDVLLYHFESLSRGEDGEDEAKWNRLLSEKEHLYERHPRFRGFDPYYSKNLVTNAREYRCNYLYEYEKRDCYVKPRRSRQNPEPYRNDCLKVTVEYAALERKITCGEPDVYLIEGWSYVMGADNSRFVRKIVLTAEDGTFFVLPVLNRYREDVVRIFPEEVHAALAGFVCRITAGQLAKGTYRLSMFVKDICSRQYLSMDTGTEIRILSIKNR